MFTNQSKYSIKTFYNQHETFHDDIKSTGAFENHTKQCANCKTYKSRNTSFSLKTCYGKSVRIRGCEEKLHKNDHHQRRIQKTKKKTDE